MPDTDPPRLNCPYCGKALLVFRVTVPGGPNRPDRLSYHCPQHGRFWIDDDGALREQNEKQKQL